MKSSSASNKTMEFHLKSILFLLSFAFLLTGKQPIPEREKECVWVCGEENRVKVIQDYYHHQVRWFMALEFMRFSTHPTLGGYLPQKDKLQATSFVVSVQPFYLGLPVTGVSSTRRLRRRLVIVVAFIFLYTWF